MLLLFVTKKKYVDGFFYSLKGVGGPHNEVDDRRMKPNQTKINIYIVWASSSVHVGSH